jgi:hypothetical protein
MTTKVMLRINSTNEISRVMRARVEHEPKVLIHFGIQFSSLTHFQTKDIKIQFGSQFQEVLQHTDQASSTTLSVQSNTLKLEPNVTNDDINSASPTLAVQVYYCYNINQFNVAR